MNWMLPNEIPQWQMHEAAWWNEVWRRSFLCETVHRNVAHNVCLLLQLHTVRTRAITSTAPEAFEHLKHNLLLITGCSFKWLEKQTEVRKSTPTGFVLLIVVCWQHVGWISLRQISFHLGWTADDWQLSLSDRHPDVQVYLFCFGAVKSLPNSPPKSICQ